MMEARVVGWDLGACAAAQGTPGFAALCGAVAISDKAGALLWHRMGTHRWDSLGTRERVAS